MIFTVARRLHNSNCCWRGKSLREKKAKEGKVSVCYVSTIWLLSSWEWGGKWRESCSVSATVLPQPKDVNMRVNWEWWWCEVCVSALQNLPGMHHGVTAMQWSFSLVDSWYPSIFSKHSEVPSLMHRGKNEILLEKRSVWFICILYKHYFRQIYNSKLPDFSLVGFNSWHCFNLYL